MTMTLEQLLMAEIARCNRSIQKLERELARYQEKLRRLRAEQAKKDPAEAGQGASETGLISGSRSSACR